MNEKQTGFEIRFDSSAMPYKHQLDSGWTFWFNNLRSDLDWKQSLKKIHNFCYIEDFWCLYSNIKTVDDLSQHAGKFEFSLFRSDIEPMVEFDANQKGGRITVILDRQIVDIDSIWLDSMLFLIGEHSDLSSEFNGIVLSVKVKTFRIAFWTRCKDFKTIQVLKNNIYTFLPNLQPFPMTFNEHKTY